jgi:hypothetical protein
MYFLAAILAFILLLPIYSAMLELIDFSVRAKMTVANSAGSSFTPLVFTSLLLPALFGNLGGPIWSQTDITQDFFYIGIIPLALYGLALASPIPWRKPLVLSWLAALLFFTVFSLGVHTPLYPFLFNHIPGFGLFRRPADAAYLINFLLALGLLVLGREAARCNPPATSHAVERDLNRGKYIVVALVLGLPFLAFALGGEANSKGAMVVLHASYGGLAIRLALLALLLISLNKIFGKSERVYPMALVVVCGLFWSVDVGLAGRYFGLFSPSYANVALAQRYLDTMSPRADSLDGWLRTHTLPWARVEVIGGYQSLGHSSMAQWHHAQGYNPIRLGHYSDRIGSFLTLHEPRVFPEGSDGPMDPRYNVLGLRYVAFPTSWLLDPVRDTSPVVVEARHYRDALAAHDGQRIFSAEGYEIWSRPGQSLWLAIAESASLADLKPAPCKLEEFRNIRLELSCDMENEGTLVLGEVHAPGWLACLNEHPAAVTPFFDVFRSVDLPAGRSTLVMTYRPVPFLRHPRC